MSEIPLLLGLLVVAYLGSMLLGGRALRGYGLPSGSEWLVLGLVLGPSVLGVASAEALRGFEPLAGIAMGWIALVLGGEYGYAGDRRVSLRGFLLGILGALLSGSLVGAAVYAVGHYVVHLSRSDAAMIAAGMGLCSCETARYAVRWATTRSAAQGPIHDLLEDMADSDEIVPLLGVGLALAFAPQVTVLQLSAAAWLGVAVVLGLGLGLVCSMLLRSMHKATDAWPVLVGAALLATGIAWRLGLSPLTVTFAMGIALSQSSRHAPELRRMLARTEPAVLLPTLLLSGALVRFEASRTFVLVVAAGVLSRLLARSLLGGALGRVSAIPKAARRPLALGFWSTGALTTLVALSFSFRFRGLVGEAVLASAFAMNVLGELIGPQSLSRALALAEPPVAPPVPSEAAS